MTNNAVLVAFAANAVSFIAGTALTWSSPMLSKLNATDATVNPVGRPIGSGEASWIGSLMPLGAAFGPFVYGFAADRWGRRRTLASLAAPFSAAYLVLAFCGSVRLFCAARFAIGVAVGGVFTVVPMYVGEVAADSNRGALGSAMNCFITAGLLFSYCVGPYVSAMWFNVLLAALPAAFLALFAAIAVETPHFLVAAGRPGEAERTLRWLRGHDGKREFDNIRTGVEAGSGGALRDVLRSRPLRRALAISLALVGLQQLSGINVVLFYAQNIFEASGSALPAAACSIAIGAVQFGTSFVTPLLADRAGRRALLVASAVGMFLAEVPLGAFFYLKDGGGDVDAIGWLPVTALICYIVTYNCGFGPLPWAIMGEIFPSNVKSIASSMTAAFCWFLGFLITKFFQSIADSLGMGPSFWLFSGFCVLAFLFSSLYLIETKGKNVQEIQKALEK